MLDFESAPGATPGGGLGHSPHSDSLQGLTGMPAGAQAALAHWLILSLDHVGRGMLLVNQSSQLLHANRLAHSTLASGSHALHLHQGRLCAGNARDDKLLADAIDAALHRGVRRMLTLGHRSSMTAASPTTAAGLCGSDAITLAVLPIEEPRAYSTPGGPDNRSASTGGAGAPATGNAVLISMPQSSRNKDLAVQIFAREQGCTGAETAVLEALLAGHTPELIAQQRKVQLCTVRTQIGRLRQKTGAHTIRELLGRVAALPPMMVVLQ